MNFKSLSLVASSAIIGSVFMTGCFFSTSTDYINNPSRGQETRNLVRGLASYISGGEAFADCNNNLILDNNSTYKEESHTVNDKGEVYFTNKACNCNIVFIGGKNSETNQSIPYPTVAPEGFNYASPITTLLVDLNETQRDAFIKSLGFDSKEDLDIDYNADNTSNKVKAFKTLVEVVLTTVASKVDLTANKEIFTTITKAVAQATIEKGSGGLDLTNPTIIESLGSAIADKLPSDLQQLQQDVKNSIEKVKDVIANVAKDGNLSKAEGNVSSAFGDKIAQANSYIKASAIEIKGKKYAISDGQFESIDLNATEDIEELLNSIKLDLDTSNFNKNTVKMVDVYLKVTQKDSDRKLQVKVTDVNITKDKIIVPADAKIKAWAIKRAGGEVNADKRYGTDSEYETNNIDFTHIFDKLDSQTNVNLYDINSTGTYDIELLISGVKVEGLKAGEINLDLADKNATGYKLTGTINIGIVSENNETNTSENNNSVSDNNGSDNDQNQTVTNQAPTLTLSMNKVKVDEGNSAEVTVTATDPDGDDVTVSVKSSDESVATAVYENGKITITGVAEGSTVVTVKATDGKESVRKSINVSVKKGGGGDYDTVITKNDLENTDTDHPISQPETGSPVTIYKASGTLPDDFKIEYNAISKEADKGASNSFYILVGDASVNVTPNGNYNDKKFVITANGVTKEHIYNKDATGAEALVKF